MKKLLAMLLALCLLLTMVPAALADGALDGEAVEAEIPAEAVEGEEAEPEEAPEETEAPAEFEAPEDDEAPEAPEEIPEEISAETEAPVEEVPLDEEELPAEVETVEAAEGDAVEPEELDVSLEEASVSGLPQVGDVVYGFEAKEIREFPAIGAQVVLFEHQRTGAQLMYIANDDTNRVFDLTFFTDAIDKTGLPHVFEHSVLDGSEKYPSKTLWFNAVYQTYNTYMNAYTQSRLTGYPVASLSEAQLLKYADYYTDSCLHPMVVEDESIFREEAWRYRLADADSPLTIEGTVYSEMRGAFDLDSAASVNALSTAFPGSTIGNEYGGEPAYIPDMTFEALQNYHSLYYHPSNSICYLYGQFDDYTAFLAQLDEAYAPYERREFVHEDPNYIPLTGPVEASFPFGVEAGSDANNASSIYYMILCPGAEGEQELILNTLTDLLTDNASALQQSLQTALPSGSFGSYIQTDGPEDAIVVYARNVNKDDAPLFKATVDAALEEIARNGFPQDQVDGVMATLNIQTLLMREDGDVGVESIIPNLAYSYAASGNPFDYMDYVEGMSHMDEWNQQGLYAQAVSDWLLNAQASALVTTYPEPGLKEQQDAALAEKLEQVKAAMSEEEIAALVAANSAEDPQADNSADIARLTAVTVESLPEEIKLYDVSDETGEDGIRRIDVPAQVDGVGQTAIFLDAQGVKQEDLHWFKLYTDLVGQLDTHSHTKAEVAQLMSRYLNGGRVYISLPGHGDDFHPYLRMSWIALDDDLATGYDLMKELVFDQKVEDSQKVLEAVQSLKASLKSSINQAPYSVQLQRANARSSKLSLYYTYVNHLEYYAFLAEVEQQLTESPEAAVERLQAIGAQLNNRANAVAIYAGSPESIALNRPLADAFLAGLGEAPIEPETYDLPVPAKSEALIIDSGVSFNGETADYATLGLEGFDGDLDALTSLVADSFLYPLLRDQYGAYSVFHSAQEYEGVYVISYRDPNIDKTFDVYSQLHDLVGTLDADQATLDGYILSAYAGYAKSQGELSGAVSAALNALQGEPQDKLLTYMRQLKAVTPDTVAKYADLYAKLDAEGEKFTAGPASAVNAEAGRYEAILNPFGAVDNSQVTLTDVNEGDAHYEAIRYVFENGLMKPASETAFGADDPATEGDAVAALYVLAGGGSADVDEAIAAFEQYGLTDVEPDKAITGAGADELLSWLAGGAWTGEGGDAELTRGELAERLMAFSEAMQAQDEAA